MMIIPLTPDTALHYGVTRMAKRPKKTNTSLRTTTEDQKLISDLQSKLGLNQTSVIRMALRRLAEAEGLKVA